MWRRELMLILAGSALAPLRTARAETRMPVIGFLDSAGAGPSDMASAAFHQGLSETGYVEGRNLAIEYRWADGHYDRLPALAADLVDRKVDVIVTVGGSLSAQAAKTATTTIPVVFSTGGDPVANGLVASLARPGGNLTGLSITAINLMPKRLELVSELVPQATVAALLINPTEGNQAVKDAMERATRAKGMRLRVLEASTEDQIDAAFVILAQLQAGVLIVSPNSFFNSQSRQLVALAARYAVPAIYHLRFYAEAGGLISYGAKVAAIQYQLGVYVGKILNGTKPADLPVQEPTKFELVINRKTANALGLTVPPALLARADEVIE